MICASEFEEYYMCVYKTSCITEQFLFRLVTFFFFKKNEHVTDDICFHSLDCIHLLIHSFIHSVTALHTQFNDNYVLISFQLI